MAGYIPLLRLARKKFYVSVHELLEDNRARTVFKHLLKGAFPVTACSRAAADWLTSLGVTPSRITVTYPVLPDGPSDRDTNPCREGRSGTFTVAVYGRLNGSKGHLEVAQAFQEPCMGDPSWRLILAGAPFPGQENALDDVLRLVDKDPRISYIGEVASLLELTADLDLVALFPKKPESFGLVPVEAWSYGIRSIGYALGGAAEVLPLVGGAVVPNNSPEVPNIAHALIAMREDWGNLQGLPESDQVRPRLSFQNRVAQVSSVLAMFDPLMAGRGIEQTNLPATSSDPS
ncbi:glycosyltransferase family 4 protein [Arthrobacter sp. NQ4]|nr:glycosyltransferase family 4 protein [Arthrobacter sp. NQ4]